MTHNPPKIDNPLTAEAGPALDNAIAIEVMGWTMSDSGVYWRASDGSVETVVACRGMFEPSTDANDALLVAERTGVLNWANTLNRDCGSWCISTGSYETLAHAQTFPLVVCRAALILARRKAQS